MNPLKKVVGFLYGYIVIPIWGFIHSWRKPDIKCERCGETFIMPRDLDEHECPRRCETCLFHEETTLGNSCHDYLSIVESPDFWCCHWRKKS